MTTVNKTPRQIVLTHVTHAGSSRHTAERASAGRWKISTTYYTVFFTKERVTSVKAVTKDWAEIARERAAQFQAHL